MPRLPAARRRPGSRRACRARPAAHAPAPARECPRTSPARQTAPAPRPRGPYRSPVMRLAAAYGREGDGAISGTGQDALQPPRLISGFGFEDGVGPDLVRIDMRQPIGTADRDAPVSR